MKSIDTREYIKYIKNGERCWEQYRDSNGNLKYLVITKNRLREDYYLISIESRQTLAKSKNPKDLRRHINILEPSWYQ